MFNTICYPFLPAKAFDCTVAATTQRKEKFSRLQQTVGVDECIMDKGDLSDGPNGYKIPGGTKILELIGGKTIADSLSCLGPEEIVCKHWHSWKNV